MTILKVTPEEMHTLAGEMRTEIQEIQTNLNNISNVINAMPAYWRGDANDKHQKNYSDVVPQGATLIKNLLTAPEDMLKIAGLYEDTEETLVQLANTLPDDIFG